MGVYGHFRCGRSRRNDGPKTRDDNVETIGVSNHGHRARGESGANGQRLTIRRHVATCLRERQEVHEDAENRNDRRDSR